MWKALALALTLSATALAQQGSYICPQDGGTETIQIEERLYRSSMAMPGQEKPYQEQFPIARRLPGKLVLGPLTDRMQPYEAIWLVEVQDHQLLLMRDGQQYATLEEIPESLAPQRQKWANRFWSLQRYQELNKLPTMPEPDREQILALLDKVRAKVAKGCGFQTMERAIEDEVIAMGYQPFASKEVFIQARKKHEKDPLVAKKIAELESWTQED